MKKNDFFNILSPIVNNNLKMRFSSIFNICLNLKNCRKLEIMAKDLKLFRFRYLQYWYRHSEKFLCTYHFWYRHNEKCLCIFHFWYWYNEKCLCIFHFWYGHNEKFLCIFHFWKYHYTTFYSFSNFGKHKTGDCTNILVLLSSSRCYLLVYFHFL